MNAVGIFVLGNSFHGGAELDGAGLVAHLAFEAGDVMSKLSGGKSGEVAFGELGFRGLELGAQLVETGFQGGQVLVEELLLVDGQEVGDLVLVFAAPLDEGGLGDLEFFGNAIEGAAFDAELNKAVVFVCRVHGGSITQFLQVTGSGKVKEEKDEEKRVVFVQIHAS